MDNNMERMKRELAILNTILIVAIAVIVALGVFGFYYL